MSNIMEKINAYFDSVSDEQFVQDLLKAGFTLRCKNHPRYQVKRKPTSSCKSCWEIWNAKTHKSEI